ncbi:hypothetical protein GUJ93_ZPchr0003g16869 [Zizania palustris]|uniref:Uncharacterized protein n=1 Tax=Zizania palustris TaxID=103762 RepID=A0A8J5RPF5_ZIZPA|nr:hypothetical protein GUJ93_ZPchr0003g16869 [Zizania palustris]
MFGSNNKGLHGGEEVGETTMVWSRGFRDLRRRGSKRDDGGSTRHGGDLVRRSDDNQAHGLRGSKRGNDSQCKGSEKEKTATR